MILLTILTLTLFSPVCNEETQTKPELEKYFNNLKPISKKVNLSLKSEVFYDKVPTGFIKISKNSNY
tara:strand:- start:3819 stop:4019 length:201 start_codon:yes stop_codon:yes gene_type:complete